MSQNRRKLIITSLISSFLLTGCATVASSIQYTKGTECLQAGDYENAVAHLERAVELDPEVSRNQNNLAAAYIALGDFEQAWIHSRQAILCMDGNLAVIPTFWEIYRIKVIMQGLDKKDTPLQEVIAKLGPPDLLAKSDDERQLTGALYGFCFMDFKDDKLVSTKNILTNLPPN